jgi:hypothetical protein
MATNSEDETVPSKGEPISRLNRPIQDLVRQAHRQRGLLLRGLIVRALRWLALRAQVDGAAGAPRRSRQS